MKQVQQKSVWKLLLRAGFAGLQLRILAIFAGLVSSIVVARALGPDHFGTYAFVLSILSILSIPVQVGLPTLVLRVTAQAVALSDWAKLRGIWIWATLMIIVGAIGVFALVTIWLTYFGNSLSTEQRVVLITGLPLVPLFAANQIRSAALRGLKHIWSAGLPDKVVRPFLLAIMVLASTLFMQRTNLTAQSAMMLASIAAAISFILGTFLLQKYQPFELSEIKIRNFEHRKWFKSILPLSLVGGVQILMQNTDLLMLGFMREDEDVGLYRVAVSVATLAIFGLTVVNLIVKPYFAESFGVKDIKRLQELAAISAAVAFFSTLAIVPLVLIFGERGLAFLYGAEFSGAYWPLVFLLFGQSASAWFGPVGALLTMGGLETRLLQISVLVSFVNIILNFILIPEFGMLGASVATGLSIGCKNILLWQEVRRLVNVDCSPLGLWKSN